MNNDYLKQYKLLVGNADAIIDVSVGSFRHFKNDDGDYDEIDTHTSLIAYNGYVSVRRFSSKLHALSIEIEAEIEGWNKEKILHQLAELKENFIIEGKKIKHKKFKTVISNLRVNESDVEQFIWKAYNSLTMLYNYLTHDFYKLFIKEHDRNNGDILFVNDMLNTFGFIRNGKSALRERGKYKLTALIMALKDAGVIDDNLSAREFMKIFWSYIKEQGEAPLKFSDAKGVNYFLSIYQKHIEREYKNIKA